INVIHLPLGFKEVSGLEAKQQVPSAESAGPILRLQARVLPHFGLHKRVINIVLLVVVDPKPVIFEMKLADAERNVPKYPGKHQAVPQTNGVTHKAICLNGKRVAEKQGRELVESQLRRSSPLLNEQVAFGEFRLERRAVDRLAQLRLQELADARHVVTGQCSVAIRKKAVCRVVARVDVH